MKKRGQIYVLAAVMISIIVYSLSTTVNVVKQESLKGEFTQLAENYNTEASRTLNSLINLDSNQETVFDGFKNFTAMFTSYSKSQNPLFGIIYTLDYGGEVQLGNFLQTSVSVDYYDAIALARKTVNSTGCFDNISAAISFEGISLDASGINMNEINLSECIINFPSPPTVPPGSDLIYIIVEEIDNTVVYTFKAEAGVSRIMIVGQQTQGTQSRVYVGGEGFEPTSSYCDPFLGADCTDGSRSSVCCLAGGAGPNCQDLGICTCSDINAQSFLSPTEKQAMCEKHPTCCWDCGTASCTSSCAPPTPCPDYTEQTLCESYPAECCWEEGTESCKYVAGCGLGCTAGTPPTITGVPNINLNIGGTSAVYNLDTYSSDDEGLSNINYEIAEETNLVVADCTLAGGRNQNLQCTAGTTIGTSQVKLRAIDSDSFASDYYDIEDLPYEQFAVDVSSANSYLSCKKQYQVEACKKESQKCKDCPEGDKIDCLTGSWCGIFKYTKTTICEHTYDTTCSSDSACDEDYSEIEETPC